MSTISEPTETEYESVFEAGDEYAFSDNLLPDLPDEKVDVLESGDGRRLTGESNPDVKLDKEAYLNLRKVDPHFRTVFWPKDVRYEKWPSGFLKLKKENYFEMLGRIHRGEQNGPVWEHSELETYRLSRVIVTIIGKRLNLTKIQMDEAIARMTNVDGEKFGRRLVLAAYCTCAYIVHNDETQPYADERKCHPNTKPANRDELFTKVAREFEIKESDFASVYGKFEREFTEIPPLKRFDSRKPDWKPNTYPESEIVTSPPEPKYGTQLWGRGI